MTTSLNKSAAPAPKTLRRQQHVLSLSLTPADFISLTCIPVSDLSAGLSRSLCLTLCLSVCLSPADFWQSLSTYSGLFAVGEGLLSHSYLQSVSTEPNVMRCYITLRYTPGGVVLSDYSVDFNIRWGFQILCLNNLYLRNKYMCS